MSRARLLIRFALCAALPAGTLFGAAGRGDLGFFWAYVGVWLVFIATCLTLDPELMRERFRPGPGGQDNLPRLRLAMLLGLGAHWGIAGWDAGRPGAGGVPVLLQVAGLIGVAAALGVWRWAMGVNRFFSSAVRIQRDRGHYVITTGPYRYVRHPGYAALLVLSVSIGLALGSWWSLLPTLASAMLFVRRAAVEDRLLRAELPGYPAYARQVRYRFAPGLW